MSLNSPVNAINLFGFTENGVPNELESLPIYWKGDTKFFTSSH